MKGHAASSAGSRRQGSRGRRPAGGATQAAPLSLAVLVVLTGAIVGCEPPTPTACDGLEDRLVGITREEYAPCAREMMTTLDTLQRQLQRLVLRRDSLDQPKARKTYRHLRLLQDRAGFVADSWREARAGSPGPRLERWPISAMREFNLHVGNASAQYMSAVHAPNQANLDRGSRHHRNARQAYARIR